MSQDLAWQIIRNNSSFLRRQRGINKLFSREDYNLKGVNSPRFNGLTNVKAIDIKVAPDGKNILFSTKRHRRNKPAKSAKTITIKRQNRQTLKAVKNLTRSHNPKSTMVAVRRASQLLRSLKVRKPRATKKTEA